MTTAQRSCRKKKAFTSSWDAVFQRMWDYLNNGITGCTEYECTVCGMWHNGRLRNG